MHAAHSESQAMADINITPLVDVMLVLLVIFMITLPMVTQTTALTLPQSSPTPPVPRPTPARLSLEADGSLRWNQRTISAAMLEAELRGLASLAEDDRPPLVLAAAGELRYERVLHLLARVQALGLRDVRLE